MPAAGNAASVLSPVRRPADTCATNHAARCHRPTTVAHLDRAMVADAARRAMVKTPRQTAAATPRTGNYAPSCPPERRSCQARRVGRQPRTAVTIW